MIAELRSLELIAIMETKPIMSLDVTNNKSSEETTHSRSVTKLKGSSIYASELRLACSLTQLCQYKHIY